MNWSDVRIQTRTTEKNELNYIKYRELNMEIPEQYKPENVWRKHVPITGWCSHKTVDSGLNVFLFQLRLKKSPSGSRRINSPAVQTGSTLNPNSPGPSAPSMIHQKNPTYWPLTLNFTASAAPYLITSTPLMMLLPAASAQPKTRRKLLWWSRVGGHVPVSGEYSCLLVKSCVFIYF